jgi:NADH-quinone oxidoreductase subunit L
MYLPLVVLAVMAVIAGWSVFGYGVQPLLEQARPPGILGTAHGVLMPHLVHPDEHLSHLDQFHVAATWYATLTGLTGLGLAIVFYGLKILNPAEVANQFRPLYTFLVHKWYFDELYNALFVQPVLFASRRVADFDKKVIDRIIDSLALGTRILARFDDLVDRYLVDGFVNTFAAWTHLTALRFRSIETGRVRQYVMFIVVGTVVLFLLISFYLNSSLAQNLGN